MPSLPRFQNPALWQQAMTHSSYANESPDSGANNERLEFLGDAILTFLSGEFLFQRYPNWSEGELTPLRAALVDQQQLGQFAQQLNLGQQLRLSRGVEGSGGRTNPRLLSSAFEALIGAYFLDSGADMAQVRQYVVPFFESVIAERVASVQQLNPKSRLQEWALSHLGEIPRYTIVAASGPDHAKQFVAEVRLQGTPYGRGSGHRKQEAEKEAARQALKRLQHP
ncbi:Ribonuclease [Halomicronema hongdechloris C2206]|uniref:Ribonuclease 3 n=1 Tax=Halomicronema hongdechloris C2206 TaxID=1641165 RepID=A0A1Z3HGS6_9CYAN|nr:ribonuclease III [Halomicronema hongdechloris]ASC69448.1 Ribonuclease [Halomicronema hongdechloris C2206]